MGLDDITLFRGITNSTVFYPSDGVSMERAVELAANTQGTCYIRSTNPPTPIIYSNLTQFTVGKAHVCVARYVIVVALQGQKTIKTVTADFKSEQLLFAFAQHYSLHGHHYKVLQLSGTSPHNKTTSRADS